MDGSSVSWLGNMGKDRVAPTPIAVILGCTMVIERGFVAFA
jgi:hypothetical protein